MRRGCARRPSLFDDLVTFLMVGLLPSSCQSCHARGAGAQRFHFAECLLPFDDLLEENLQALWIDGFGDVVGTRQLLIASSGGLDGALSG